MAMNYKVVEDKPNSVYNVVENNTGHIIKSFREFHEARKLMKHLNLGGGFDSWTPQFFLKNFLEEYQKSCNSH